MNSVARASLLIRVALFALDDLDPFGIFVIEVERLPSDRRCSVELLLRTVGPREVGCEFDLGIWLQVVFPTLPFSSSLHGGGAKLVFALAPRRALAAGEDNDKLDTC